MANQENKGKIVKDFQSKIAFVKSEAAVKKDNALKNLMSSYDSIKDKSDDMIPYLIDLLKIGEGNEAVTRLRKKLTSGIDKMGPELKEIIFEEALNFLNCNLDFTLDQNVPLYVKVKTVDLFRTLKIDPSTGGGKQLYEKTPIAPGIAPFSMDRELHHRLSVGVATQSYSSNYGVDYQGGSLNELFDMEYVGFDGAGNPGDFFKCTPKANVSGGDYKITEFLRDYYNSIEMFQKPNFIAAIFESLTGSLSVQVGKSSEQLNMEGKFGKFLKRLMGICDDTNNDVDVSAVGHLEEDGVDDSFFEFDAQDLREIQDETDLKMKGLIKFTDCTNIEKPVDVNAINAGIQSLIDENNSSVSDIKVDNLIDETLLNLNINIPLPQIKAEFDTNVFKNLPKIIMGLLIKPKVLLPIGICAKSLQNDFDSVNLQEFMKDFKRMVKRILKRIIDLVITIIMAEVKRAILKIVSIIIQKVVGEKFAKQIAIIQSLINILMQILQLLDDFANCRNVLNQLFRLLKIPNIPGGVSIPMPLLFATSIRPGFSDTKAFMGVLEKYQEMGLPTGDLPDGSPNPMLMLEYQRIKAVESERSMNSVVKSVNYPMTVATPSGPGVAAPGTITGLIA
tara:strand:+ start:3987 stop:5843 length:1857 start_codon:yes stop_codon:yes gene_type:complete